MSRVFSLLFVICCFCTSHAQVLDSLFINMPSAIIPYLEKDQRLDLIDFAKANRPAIVLNQLGDTCQLEIYTNQYMCLKLSSVSTFELKLIHNKQQQPLLLVCETLCTQGCDSKLTLFDTLWKRIEAPQLTTPPSVADFVINPAIANKLTKSIPFPLIKAVLTDQSNDIEFRLNVQSLVDKKEWIQIAPQLNPSIKRHIHSII